MKITGIETFVVSNGFTPPRPWHFCAIRTDAGLTGYSEFGSDGITRGLVGLVQDLGQRLIGKDPTAVEKHYVDLYRAVRQAPYGATSRPSRASSWRCGISRERRSASRSTSSWAGRTVSASGCTGRTSRRTGRTTGSFSV